MQGNSFVNCPNCSVEHLVSDLEAIASETESPAYALCERCQGFCTECGTELDEDWDIYDGAFFGVCFDCELDIEDRHFNYLNYDNLLFGDLIWEEGY